MATPRLVFERGIPIGDAGRRRRVPTAVFSFIAGVTMTYLNNAATSCPKPPSVLAATSRFMDKVAANPGRSGRRLAVVLFNTEGMDPSQVELWPDEEHGVMCRVGVHCAPAAHKTIATLRAGTVRELCVSTRRKR